MLGLTESEAAPEAAQEREPLASEANAVDRLRADGAGSGNPTVGACTVPDGAGPLISGLLDAVSVLIEEVGSAMEGEHETAEECLRQVCSVLRQGAGAIRSPLKDSSGDPHDPHSARCCLAPWQIRRLTTHIESNLSSSLRCEDLAKLVRLSLSHFMRAFKATFGYTPHMFVMRRRFERAQGLMLTTYASLGEIALECGLADQSHLSRIFQRFARESPGAWRRAREDRGVDQVGLNRRGGTRLGGLRQSHEVSA